MRITPLLPSLLALQLAAQEPIRIWGLTPNGGANNKGTVFSVNADGSDFTTVFHFDDASGWGPEGGLCLAPNGLLYGLTTFGGEGAPPAGTLFTINPADGAFTKLHDFQITDGGYNWGRPILGGDGLLYFAGYAGSDGGGGIFRLDPANNAYTELYALDQATDGGAITGRLLQASDGLFYGTASQGGDSGESGTIFRYDALSGLFTKLHDFDGDAGGRAPYGGVCEAGNGWFYGTTYEGGLNNRGIVYKYNAGTNVFTKIHDISDDDGLNCWNSLLRLGPDLLIGGVANGSTNSGGYLFTVVPSTDSVAVVTHFSLLTGANPVGDLVSAPDGQLYGLLSQGGDEFFGTLCRFDPLTYQPTVLTTFSNGDDGGLPRGEVAFTGADVGMAEPGSTAFFSVSPNPASGPVVVRCAVDHLPATAYISDALGRTLQVLTITDVPTAIDLGDASGIVSVTLTGARGTHTALVVRR